MESAEESHVGDDRVYGNRGGRDLFERFDESMREIHSLKAKTDDLQAQTDDLRAQTDDLRAETHDLQAQTDVLRAASDGYRRIRRRFLAKEMLKSFPGESTRTRKRHVLDGNRAAHHGDVKTDFYVGSIEDSCFPDKLQTRLYGLCGQTLELVGKNSTVIDK